MKIIIQLVGWKREKEDKNVKNKEKKKKKQQKQNANSAGRSYSPPKLVWELLLDRQLQIILGGKLFGPQARLRITPIVWFEPATSMTSLALVARLRLPLDHLETKLSVYWVLKYQVWGGGGWGTLFYWECNRGFPAKNKGNESCKELTKAIYTRNIAICCDGGRLHLLKLVNVIRSIYRRQCR